MLKIIGCSSLYCKKLLKCMHIYQTKLLSILTGDTRHVETNNARMELHSIVDFSLFGYLTLKNLRKAV